MLNQEKFWIDFRVLCMESLSIGIVIWIMILKNVILNINSEGILFCIPSNIIKNVFLRSITPCWQYHWKIPGDGVKVIGIPEGCAKIWRRRRELLGASMQKQKGRQCKNKRKIPEGHCKIDWKSRGHLQKYLLKSPLRD